MITSVVEAEPVGNGDDCTLLSNDPLGRRGRVNASLNGIYLAIGLKREDGRVREIEGRR